MSYTLERGQRLPLTQVLSGQSLTLHVHLPGLEAADVSIFGLDAERQLSDDRYFVFYNQTKSPEGAIELEPAAQRFRLDLSRVPLGIHRLMLAATSDEQTFAELQKGAVNIADEHGDNVLFEVGGHLFQAEQAIMLVEIYRHQGVWRIAGVAQGFSGGLAALLQSFGGVVAEPAPADTPSEPTQPEQWPELRGGAARTLPPRQHLGQFTGWPRLNLSARHAEVSRADAKSCMGCGKKSTMFARAAINDEGLCETCALGREALLGTLQSEVKKLRQTGQRETWEHIRELTRSPYFRPSDMHGYGDAFAGVVRAQIDRLWESDAGDWEDIQELAAALGLSAAQLRELETYVQNKEKSSAAADLKARQERFRTRFLAASADGALTYDEWLDLQRTAEQEQLSANEALSFIRADALQLVERAVTGVRADGAVTATEQQQVNELIRILQLPANMVAGIHKALTELREAGRIREGYLPTLPSTLILEAGEITHFECAATYRHVTASRTRDIAGRLILTNRQIHFVTAKEGGWTIQYAKVLGIEGKPDGINLSLGVKKGSGAYRQVEQPVLLEATLEALTRMHKRLLLMPQGDKASRSIPQKIKLAVWQRDSGKCVECGDANYLEFDHVIPISLGGATSVENLQLLCRRCNLKKSNRI